MSCCTPSLSGRGGGGGWWATEGEVEGTHALLDVAFSCKDRKMHVLAVNYRLFDVNYHLFKVIFNSEYIKKKMRLPLSNDRPVLRVTVLISGFTIREALQRWILLA